MFHFGAGPDTTTLNRDVPGSGAREAAHQHEPLLGPPKVGSTSMPHEAEVLPDSRGPFLSNALAFFIPSGFSTGLTLFR